MTEPTAEQINAHIDKFTDIYVNGKESNPIPIDQQVTVWCDGLFTSGFLYDVNGMFMDPEVVYPQKWILQSELDELLANSLASPLPLSNPDR